MPGAVFSLAMGPGAVALHRYRVSKSGVAPFQGPGAVAQAPIAIVFPRSVTKMHGYEYPWSPLRLQMETYGLNKATSVRLNRILLCRLDRILLPQPKKRPAGCPWPRDAALTTVHLCHLRQSFAAKAGIPEVFGADSARHLRQAAQSPCLSSNVSSRIGWFWSGRVKK